MEKFITSKDLLIEEIDNSLVILDVKKGSFFELKSTGLEIWKLLEIGKTKDELTKEIKNKYSGETIDDDIDIFLEEMLSKGFLSIDK